MKRHYRICIVSILFSIRFLNNSYGQFPPIARYVKVFEDNFEGNDLDQELWEHSHDRNLIRNQELQYYQLGNTFINNGKLILRAKNEIVSGPVVDYRPCSDILADGFSNCRSFNYTSGQVQTKQKFKYGSFEIRCKMPSGKGCWPAFWLYAGFGTDEIDIFEFEGSHHYEAPSNYHYLLPDNSSFSQEVRSASANDLTLGFNTFRVDWLPHKIFWFINGVLVREASHTFSYPMTLILNFAISSSHTGDGPPDQNTIFPQDFEIEYVKVWSPLVCSDNQSVCNHVYDFYDPVNNYTTITGGNLKLGGSGCNFRLNGTFFPSNINGDYLTAVATNEIILDDGFVAEETSHFVARITDCITATERIEKDSTNQNKISDKPPGDIELYPNPTQGIFTIRTRNNTVLAIKVYSPLGEEVYTKNSVNESETLLDFSNMSGGIYLIKIFLEGNNRVEYRKIIIF